MQDVILSKSEKETVERLKEFTNVLSEEDKIRLQGFMIGIEFVTANQTKGATR